MAKISMIKMLESRIETLESLIDEKRKTIQVQKVELDRIFQLHSQTATLNQTLGQRIRDLEFQLQVMTIRQDASQWINVLAHNQVKDLIAQVRLLSENKDSLSLASETPMEFSYKGKWQEDKD